MSMAALAIGFSVLGAVMELVGIVLVILEIRDRAGRLRECQTSLHSAPPPAALARPSKTTSHSPSRSPSATHRGEARVLERKMEAVPEQIRDSRREVMAQALGRAREYTDSAAVEVRDDIGRVTSRLVDPCPVTIARTPV